MHKSIIFHPIFEHENLFFLNLFLVKNEEHVLTKRKTGHGYKKNNTLRRFNKRVFVRKKTHITNTCSEETQEKEEEEERRLLKMTGKKLSRRRN